MITATVNADAVKKKLAYIIEDMPTAVAIGVNSTAKKARNESAKAIKKEMGPKVPLKVVRSAVRAKAVASKSHLAAIVALQSGYPISLRYFNPRQSKKRGVSVQLNRKVKGNAGRTSLPSAFIAKRLGGKVFERAGKSRLPIKEQFGPSPGQFSEAAGVKDMAVTLIRKELPKRIQRRIRFLLLKQSGGLRGNQPSRNQ
jgi:hypothetical protein